MTILIDTCVLPRSQLETAAVYRERFGDSLGFELLMMFDLPDFEENLRKNLSLFVCVSLMFHEPVWGVDHAAPKGSQAWEEGMYHLNLTRKFAQILKPGRMVCHLNNGVVRPERKDAMIRNSLENLDEMRTMFPGVELLVENTGTRTDGTMLLDQDEFTDFCRARHLPVLVDVGHANANGWDIPRLVKDLREQIGGFHLHNNDGIHDQHNRLRNGTIDFRQLIPILDRETPKMPRVIEYTRPDYHGVPLMEDISFLCGLSGNRNSQEGE